jgi:Reverse transcriptase (RNA-dependent DNA polymerase)/gag-polypeptide of LTR copia-type/GAG-pre-integrase domain/Integrase core domain
MTSSAQLQLNTIPFNSKVDQFRIWKLKVESYLDSLGFTDEINGIKSCLDSDRNKKVKSFLLLSIGDETLSVLTKVKESTSNDLWKQLCEYHERSSTMSRLQLKSQLLTERLRPSEKVNEFISRIVRISEQLKLCGKPADEEDLLLCLLRGISANSDYEMISVVLKNQDGLSFAKACQRVLDREVELDISSDAKGDTANYVNKPKHTFNEKHKSNGNYCQWCKKKGHNYENCDRRLKRCHLCHQTGHFAKDCKVNNNKDKHNNDYNNDNMNNSSSHENSDKSNSVVTYSDKNQFVGYAANNGQSYYDWIIDSGCTSHYCNNISLLRNIRDDDSIVTCANNQTISINKIGEVIMENDHASILLLNVKYNAEFAHNLISIPKLVENGATVLFEDNQAIIKNNKFIIRGIKRDGLYYLKNCKIKNQSEQVLVANDELSESHLIHNRLGHMGKDSLSKLFKHKAVKESIEINSDEMKCCEACSIGKAHRNAFGKSSSREIAKHPLERIHCDLSSFNKKYVSVIVDEYSRKASIKILNNKYETADHIKSWISLNENKLNLKVKEFHSDGGGEYIASTLQTFFIEKGIKSTITCKGTPQHNGIAERYNRTLFNTARCLLQHSKLSLDFAEYAVTTAAYLLQFRLSVTDQNKTAYELFYKRKPTVKHLKVFGCDSFVHTSDNSKLEPRAMKGIFVGYSELNENGYQILLLDTDKEITSRDVTFEENKFTFGIRLQESRMKELLQLNYNSFNSNSTFSIPISNYNESDNDGHVNSDSYYPNCAEEQKNDSHNNSSNSESRIIPSRPQRNRRKPQRYGVISMNDVYDEDRNEINLNAEEKIIQDPLTVEEALCSARAEKWKAAMNEEMEHLENNDTWTLCELPADRRAIDNRWVFKTKLNSDGTIEREKARLVAKGYSQIEHVDFTETFAPVMKYKSLRIVLAFATIKDYEIEHLDVQTAFLNATLKEDIYMKQPEYYEVKSKGEKELVCKLNKSIYGLKQASNEWNKEISNTIKSFKFNQCKSDTCVYWKQSINNNVIILAIFVDDIIVIHSPQDNAEWDKLKEQFKNKYKIKDNKNSNFILGMRIERGGNSLKISQPLQIDKVLKEFEMDNCKSKDTPSELLKLSEADCPITEDDKLKMEHFPYKSLVGNLLYLSICTRPDISYSVNRVSRFMKNPGEKHWIACKRILRYLKSTSELGLSYQNNRNDDKIILSGYCDADWAGDVDDRKSTTGYIIKINGCLINWVSKKQSTVSLSSAEAEYMSISATIQEMQWIRSLLKELNILSEQVPILYCDNQSAIAISENDKFHNRTKHIDIRHHYIRETIKNKEVELKWIASESQEADILTKSLSKPLFEQMRLRIMMAKK